MASRTKFIDRMRYWCNDGNLGYDQSNRWDIRQGGECDCSSLVIFALREAGYDTGDASYTGNLSSNLTKRGWKRIPVNGQPQAGDILLNDADHVAVWLGDCLAQASIDENGNIAGGQSGDQGNETNCRSYYDYPWNCYLRYSGGDDMDSWPLQSYTINMTNAQRFRPTRNTDGTYTFVNVATGKVLDVNANSSKSGAMVQVYKPNGTDAQKWTLARQAKSPKSIPYNPSDVAPFTLTPKCAPKCRLEIKNADTRDCSPIQIYTANNSNGQNWAILDCGDGSWIFVNVATGKVLDVAGGGK